MAGVEAEEGFLCLWSPHCVLRCDVVRPVEVDVTAWACDRSIERPTVSIDAATSSGRDQIAGDHTIVVQVHCSAIHKDSATLRGRDVPADSAITSQIDSGTGHGEDSGPFVSVVATDGAVVIQDQSTSCADASPDVGGAVPADAAVAVQCHLALVVLLTEDAAAGAVDLVMEYPAVVIQRDCAQRFVVDSTTLVA